MHLRLVFLLLGCVATGCAHRELRPALPPPTASHGHLSLAMEYFLEDPNSVEERIARTPNFAAAVSTRPPLDAPTLELEPGQAPGVFEEATQVLKGQPTEPQVRQALSELQAACDADHEAACRFLKEQSLQPSRLEGDVSHPLGPSLSANRDFAVVIVQCRLDADGRMRDCQAIEDGPLPFAPNLIAQLNACRYRPWTLAGHPMSTPFGITFNLHRGGSSKSELSLEQKVGWAQQRAARFPESSAAWSNLAMQLAVQRPDDPAYPQALERAYAMAPQNRWTATEMAWRRVQAGQYAAALMALRPVIRRSARHEPLNPYVLETAAAAYFGLRQCTEALAEQQQAVALLPKAWPEPEHARFQLKLQEYQTACAALPAVSATPDPR
ncbi:hypothetical protein [Corallococcus sp. Z5C101001]|uniref:tetratricopeptide repeat protein n=1 Tax=Corallococcus sp. Z5C101001 TaxID=2596829 RepID=UPI0011816716|nr:hypothetical protein [Corallococcus sp. Z5C101001]TSC32747.1 hypothetical protein FOF48_07010 [Corallococcus sp. Z5C101001]